MKSGKRLRGRLNKNYENGKYLTPAKIVKFLGAETIDPNQRFTITVSIDWENLREFLLHCDPAFQVDDLYVE